LKIYIPLGSVATQLKYGDILSNHFIINFPQNVPVKSFRKSVNIWRQYGQKFAAYFLNHLVQSK